jgi:ATP-dependent Clp protease adapter protein ClpS
MVASMKRSIPNSICVALMVLMFVSLVKDVRSFVPTTQRRVATYYSSSTTQMAASITIEREDVIVLPKIREERGSEAIEERRSRQGNESWEVRIYNDGLNTREHVARCLVQVTGLSELQAYSTMMLAHHQGMASVGQWVYEIAEMYHDALRSKGIICDIIPVDGQN